MPAVEALLPRFEAAHTQVLGVSVDSIHSHANWGNSMGGISFPLLSDFQPRGAVANAFGLYLEGAGITDRATVIIDSSGIVRYLNAVGPGGQRDIAELAQLCEQIDKASDGPTEDFAAPPGVPDGSVLFVKSHCGFSTRALLARSNLHLEASIEVRDGDDSENGRKALVDLTGKQQVPCLVVDGAPIFESDDIVKQLVRRGAPAR